MAQYPKSDTEQRIMPHVLVEAVKAIFCGCGMESPDANLLATTLVHADQRGIHSHGTLRVPEYVRKMTLEGVNPRGRPRIVRDNGNAIIVDGDNAMGQIVADFSMRAAIQKAAGSGIALAAARNSNHCGAMDCWAALALEHDMIGIATTNALPTMAPWGGVEKIVGINPLAAAFPAGEEEPIVLDTAFGATAHGKIRVYHQKGERIPEDWAFDRDGRPTTDTTAALSGLIQPIGGHKGVGLAIVTGILSTLLSGASYGTELGNMSDGPRPGHDGHMFIAIDVASFQPVTEFKARVDSIARQIRKSRRRDGIAALYPPGLMEAEFARKYAVEGIPLNEETIAGLRTAAMRMKVAFPALTPPG